MKIFVLAVVLLVGSAWGQGTSTPPVSASPAVSLEAQNKILKAEHSFDQTVSEKQVILLKVNDLNKQWQDADARQKAAGKEVEEAIDAAYKAAGVTKELYNFDPANFTFSPKPKEQAKK